jgi:hypothetical protein
VDSHGLSLVDTRAENNNMKKKSSKSIYPARLTVSEELIWSAVYAIEYNRWTCRSDLHPINFEVKAARIAIMQASMAVLAARAAVSAPNRRLLGPNISVLAFAQQMLQPDLAMKTKVRKHKGK